MASASFETTECSICHDELQDNEEISWLPCRHGFHTECLDAYSSVKGKEWLDMPCPMCKVVPRITEIAGLAQAEADTDTVPEATAPIDEFADSEVTTPTEAPTFAPGFLAAPEAAAAAPGLLASVPKVLEAPEAAAAAEAIPGKAVSCQGKAVELLRGKAAAAQAPPKAELAKMAAARVPGKKAAAQAATKMAAAAVPGKAAAAQAPAKMAMAAVPSEAAAANVPPNEEPAKMATAAVPSKAAASKGKAAVPIPKGKAAAKVPKAAAIPKGKAESKAAASTEVPPGLGLEATTPVGKCDLCKKDIASDEKYKVVRAEVFRCPKCCSTRTRLFKEGRWSDACSLNEDDTEDFFANAQTMSRADMIAKLDSLKVTNTESQREETRKHGRFLPLSVWANKGFDPELIKAESGPEDQKYVKQMGLCYRVVTEADDFVEAKGWTADDVQERSSSAEPRFKAARHETPHQLAERIRREAAENKQAERAKAAEQKLMEKVKEQLIKLKDKEVKSINEKALQPLTATMATMDPKLRSTFAGIASELAAAITSIQNAATVEDVIAHVQAFNA